MSTLPIFHRIHTSGEEDDARYDLVIEYADGTNVTVCRDARWEVLTLGAIRKIAMAKGFKSFEVTRPPSPNIVCDDGEHL